MALTSFKKVFSPVSLFVLALLHLSFISDSVCVGKEIETNALLIWKANLQNKNCLHGLSFLIIMQPILPTIKMQAQIHVVGSVFLATLQEVLLD